MCVCCLMVGCTHTQHTVLEGSRLPTAVVQSLKHNNKTVLAFQKYSIHRFGEQSIYILLWLNGESDGEGLKP